MTPTILISIFFALVCLYAFAVCSLITMILLRRMIMLVHKQHQSDSSRQLDINAALWAEIDRLKGKRI